MDGMGSEVNNKMRSAVKAKLIELGSGTAGYIDDELPDYVMIMVANKRSKEQMVGDLSLFLGKNTDTFVNWLHQVLEKLQEVTLPSAAPAKPKHKTNETSAVDKRNDKKSKPKKRGGKEKTPEKVVERSTTPPIQSVTPSITDVFADHLIQKAKKVIEPPLSVKKAEKSVGSTNDGFDIPTISEIAKKAVGAVVCRKEITELAELQKKIDQAKRQLRHMADESEDEDFLNLGADKMDFDAELSNNGKDTAAAASVQPKSSDYEPSTMAKGHQKITFDERDTHLEKDLPKKQSVLDRLGNRNEADAEKSDKTERSKNIISLSAHRRMEQAIYVPAHRRTSEQQAPASTSRRTEDERRTRDRSPRGRSPRDRSPIRRSDYRRSTRGSDTRSRDDEPRDLREKVNKQRNRDIELRSTRLRRDASGDRREPREIRETRETNRTEEKPSITNRIGSRVIVAPVKPEHSKVEDIDEEEPIEVPLNSVVKVKPRPLIPRSRQASKNLLLRAVAEAQKSTALVKPQREFAATERSGGGTKELYTKSFRKKLHKDNIVVEIAADDMDGTSAAIVDELEIEEEEEEDEEEVQVEEEEEEEEYVPQALQATPIEELIEDDPFIYIPQSIHNNGLKDTDGPKTQFVVTLDSLGFPTKKPTTQKGSISEQKRNKPLFKADERKKTPILNRIGKRPQQNTENGPPPERRPVEDNRNKSSPPTLKRKRTPIRFDINDDAAESKDHREPTEKKRRSKSSDRKSADNNDRDRKSSDRDAEKRKRDSRSKERERERESAGESNSKIRTLKTSSQNKYDNLPPLSSAITVTSEIKLTKKERCKFYPVCTRGDRCDYFHPTTPCKSFPNCKYGDICLYIHPKCKFDLTCSRLDCNFTHTPVATAAPPLASHVVPVSNYKKIVTTPLPTLCRFYPNCSNTLCEFYHPKPCKFGKSCTNKVECNFYHFDLPTSTPASTSMPMKNKLKWVASAV